MKISMIYKRNKDVLKNFDEMKSPSDTTLFLDTDTWSVKFIKKSLKEDNFYGNDKIFYT